MPNTTPAFDATPTPRSGLTATASPLRLPEAPPAAGIDVPIGNGVVTTPQINPADLLGQVDVQGQFDIANNILTDIQEGAEQFVDPEQFTKPLTDAFDQFSTQAREMQLSEARIAQDDLLGFVNNNQDTRAAVNTIVAQKIKSQALNASIAAVGAVNLQFGQAIFEGVKAAGENFVAISSVLAQGSSSLFQTAADFAASLTSSAAQIFNSEMNFASTLANNNTALTIARIEDATRRRGQDVTADIAAEDRESRERIANDQIEAANRPSTTVPPPVVNTPTIAPPSVTPPPTGGFVPNITVGPGATTIFDTAGNTPTRQPTTFSTLGLGPYGVY